MLKPANLRLLTSIAGQASELGTPLSVCGEMAATPAGVTALVGCGYRAFSVSAAQVPRIKAVLSALDVAAVERQIQAFSKRQGGSLRDEIAALAGAFDP